MAGNDNNVHFNEGVRLEPSTVRGQGNMQKTANDLGLMNVSGDPEGVVSANPGSKAFDRASGCEYIKVTGTGNTGWERIESGETVATTYQSDAGSAQASNNILDIVGIEETSTRGSSNDVSIFSPRLARFVVDPTTDRGTHTTIASAVAAASSGDSIMIRPGTYTENFTDPGGLNFFATPNSNINGNVKIVGKISQTATGTSTYSGIRFQTNGDDILSFGGSGTIQTNFFNCSFFLTDGDCFTVNNASCSPNFNNCQFHQTADSLDIFNIISCGTAKFVNCRTFNASSVPGISDIASGIVQFVQTSVQEHRFTTQTGANFQAFDSRFEGDGNNIVLVTTAGTGASHELRDCKFSSGTAAAISIGSGTTCTIGEIEVNSTNANPVTGAGTITYGEIVFSNTGNGINVTTKTARSVATGQISFDDGTNYLDYYEEGSWTPELTGSTGAPTIAYTSQIGRYTRVGNIVHVKALVIISSISGGTGSVRITNLPFTSANDGCQSPTGGVIPNGVNYDNAATFLTPAVPSNVAYAAVYEAKDAATGSAVGITDFSASDNITIGITYRV